MMIWIFRFIIATSILYNALIWSVKVKGDYNGNIVAKEIIFIDCNATKGSSIKVKNGQNAERIEIPRNVCKNLSETNTINLIYNKFLKSYHFPQDRSNRNILLFLVLIFLISFVNLNKLKNRFENKIILLSKN